MSQLNGKMPKLLCDKYTLGDVALWILKRVNLADNKFNEADLLERLADDSVKHKITVPYKIGIKVIKFLVTKGYLEREFYDPQHPHAPPDIKAYVSCRVFIPGGYKTCFEKMKGITSAKLLPTREKALRIWGNVARVPSFRKHTKGLSTR